MVKIIIEDVKIKKIKGKNNYRKEPVFSEEEFFDKRRIFEKDNKEVFNSNYNIDKKIFFDRSENISRQIKTSKTLRKSVFVFLFVFLILGGIYWGGDYFQKTNISIETKHQTINYKNKEFIASKIKENKGVNFEVMMISDKKTKNTVLTETKNVSLKAKGSIIINNKFSITPQKILAGSFIADDEGKTYKTDDEVIVPGYKIENSKIIPGQSQVNITAFLPGDIYNGSPSNFYISSFKGTKRYDKIYGELNTPLVGGALGLVYYITEKDKDNLTKLAETYFKDSLFTKVESLVPEEYILYPDASNFSFKIDENVYSKKPEVEVEINGSLSIILLEENSLINNIIKNSLPDLPEEELKEIKITNLKNLTFNFVDMEQTILKEMETFPFFLSGDVEAIWTPNAEMLKRELSGVSKDNVLNIFKEDPSIASAKLKIFPPWKKTLPVDPENIFITIKNQVKFD